MQVLHQLDEVMVGDEAFILLEELELLEILSNDGPLLATLFLLLDDVE